MDINKTIVNKLKQIYDPELPVNIWDLGLIYEINVNGTAVNIRMTLTAPNCPAAGSLPFEVEQMIKEIEGIESVNVELTWNPKWEMEMMSEVAKLELGFL